MGTEEWISVCFALTAKEPRQRSDSELATLKGTSGFAGVWFTHFQ